MSARNFMGALDAYLDARDAYNEAVGDAEMVERRQGRDSDTALVIRRISGEVGTERLLATARVDLERAVNAIINLGL